MVCLVKYAGDVVIVDEGAGIAAAAAGNAYCTCAVLLLLLLLDRRDPSCGHPGQSFQN